MSAGTLMTSCQISGISLVIMTSQLFDSSSSGDDSVTSIKSARLVMIIMTACSFVGLLFLLLVKENLKRTQHEMQLKGSLKS